MYKNIVEAVLYNSCGMEIARKSLSGVDISKSLAAILTSKEWSLDEGDTIKIESRMIKYY